MKNRFSRLLVLLLIFTIFVPLLISAEAIDYEKLSRDLISKAEVNRENPFFVREFIPYLNGEWIGNAISYGCYREGQAPGVKGPSKKEILEDLRIIEKHWNLIRVYNADDDTERLLEVIAENELPVKVMLGVWLENDENKKKMNIENTVRCLKLLEKYEETIIAVNVGNETQVFWSWHKMAENDLIRYIRTIRKYSNVPVTTADDYNFWNKPESKAVAEEVDFIVTHIYPLWNGKKLDKSIEWLEENFVEISKLHSEKVIVLGEIGWATDYNSARKGPGEQGTLVKGEVSVNAQEKFYTVFSNWTGENEITTFWFEVFDEPWKGGGENTSANEIEKNWGLFYENRAPKQSFTNFLKNKSKAY